jgi:general secretion pathway protein F
MAEFAYKALDATGRYVSGNVQALSASSATQQLRELGYIPLETASARIEHRRGFSVGWLTSRVSPREITVLLQDLALLLRSGLPLDEGLGLLAEGARGGTTRLLQHLRDSISSGAGFADALRSDPATAIPDLVAIVQSAEATGNLEGALETIAVERAKQERVRASMRAALRYPLFLILFSIAVLTFFLLFVVPQFASVIHDFGTKPDPLVTTVIGISNFLRTDWGVILGALAVLGAIVILAARSPAVRTKVSAFLARLPLISGVIGLRRTALFCRSLGTLLVNGVNLTDALRLMIETGVGGARLPEVFDRVRRGGRLVDAISATGLVPALAARMLRVGEESGSLGVVTNRCADYYEAKLNEQVNRFTGFVGPAAIIIISMVIGTLIVSVMSTLLSINQMVM